MSEQPQSSESSHPGVLDWRSIPLRQFALGTSVVTLVVLAIVMLILLRDVLILLLLGIFTATALMPVADYLRQRRMGRSSAAGIAFLLLLLLLGALLGTILPFFLSQTEHLATDLPRRYASLRSMIAAMPSGLLRALAGQLPADPFARLISNQGIALGTAAAALLPGIMRDIALGILVLL